MHDYVHEAFFSACGEPLVYKQAINSQDSEKWIKSMQEEITSLKENETWELVDRPPPEVTVLKNKWVYKIKYGANEVKTRFKARLVVKGYQQKLGQDYNETFSPVARYESVRAFISVAEKRKIQFDVKTVFLNAVLRETIYIWSNWRVSATAVVK